MFVCVAFTKMSIQLMVPSGRKLLQLVRASSRINHKSNIRHLKQPEICGFHLFTAFAFLWPFKSKDDPSGSNPVEATKVDNTPILNKADNLFENGYYEECYHLLTSSNMQDKQDVEIEWRKCRVLYNMSKDTKYDENFKKKCTLEAYDVIAKQLQHHCGHFAVHKWYALMLDAKSTLVGIKERVRQMENVKKHMDLAVTINPNDATTLHMLGEWCYQVTELPWHQRKIAEVLFASPPYSTYEDALEYFLRAETAQPRFYSLNLLRLGACYLRLNKEDQAKYYLKLAACYPAKSNDDHYANKEAAELLKQHRLQ